MKTQVILIKKVDENTFFADFLYGAATSYSKSLYPTITRTFTTESKKLMGGGTYKQTEEQLEVKCHHELWGSMAPYYIKRVTWTTDFNL